MGSRRLHTGSRVLRLACCFRGRRGFESRSQHRCHLGRRLRLRLRRGRIEGRAGPACARAGRRRRRAKRRIEQRRNRRRRQQDLGWRRRDDDRPCGRHRGQRRERSDHGRRCRRSDGGGRRCNDWDGYSAVSILRIYLTSDIGLNLWRYGTRAAQVPVPDPTGYPSINRPRDTRCGDIAAPCPVPRPRHRCGCCRRRRGRDGSGGIRVRDWRLRERPPSSPAKRSDWGRPAPRGQPSRRDRPDTALPGTDTAFLPLQRCSAEPPRCQNQGSRPGS